MKAPARTLLLLPLLAACKEEMVVNISGEVDGFSLNNTVSASWGGPFIVFSDRELDCEEFAWVQKTNLDGDTVPTDFDVTALQITYNDSDVVSGTYNLEGEAPVKAEVLNVTDEIFTVIRATGGTMTIEDFEPEGFLTGTFALAFEDESVTGDFSIPWCTNLKSRI